MCSPTLDALHIKSLVAELNSTLEDPVTLNEAGRITAITAAKRLTQALETPEDAITQQLVTVSLSEIILQTSNFSLLIWKPKVMLTTFNQTTSLACTKIAVDLDLFNALLEDSHQPKTATKLATRCGAEPLLIGQTKLFVS